VTTPALARRARLWGGTALIVAGVLLHAVDLAAAADEAYRLAGMGISAMMWAGMGLILVGLPLAASAVWRSRPAAEPTSRRSRSHPPPIA
jgi:putative MFS transporter